MDDLKKFITNYWGGILGGIATLILGCTGAYRVLIVICLICFGIWAGNYFQHNKDKVKTNIKKFVDKM